LVITHIIRLLVQIFGGKGYQDQVIHAQGLIIRQLLWEQVLMVEVIRKRTPESNLIQYGPLRREPIHTVIQQLIHGTPVFGIHLLDTLQ